MMQRTASILPEVEVDPLGDMMLRFLIDRDAEEPYVDFKEIIDIGKNAPFAKLAKDIFAFANYGGGIVLVGFKERSDASEPGIVSEAQERNFIPVGLPNNYHLDQASLQDKFNAYSISPIELRYREFHLSIRDVSRRFGAIYVPPSFSVLRPKTDGIYSDRGKIRLAFKSGSALIRRGTQSIVATEEEETWIKKRAEETSYRISIFSGRPDFVQEAIYSNMLPVQRLPDLVWTAVTAKLTPGESEYVFVPWMNGVATLSDLSDASDAILNSLNIDSLSPEPIADWLSHKNNKPILIQLLNAEISALANRIGLSEEPEKGKFYYQCNDESRTETWKTRSGRLSTLTVAQRIWAQQLKKYVYWHAAVIARFARFEDHLFLRISPTIQLTENGRETIFGPREGTVITRLTYNKYNASYLNSLLFWAYKFSEGKENISLGNGAIRLSTNLSNAIVNAGIVFDRPVTELLQDTPDLQIEEIA
jgi:hypothetical protein